jgi:hypothetical protein
VEVHAGAYLTALAAAGVVGPSTWRVGNDRVVRVRGALAEVLGCSYDIGSHYKATGVAAPPSLGGGPGYTGYDTTVERVHGQWEVYAAQTSSPTSTAQAGPCRGF